MSLTSPIVTKLKLLCQLSWKSDKLTDGRVLHKNRILVLEVRLKLYFPRGEFMRLVIILAVTLVFVLGSNRSAFVMEFHYVYYEVGNYILINFRPQKG